MATDKGEIKGIQECIHGLVDDELLTKGANNMFFTFLMAVEGDLPKNLQYDLEEYLSYDTRGAQLMKMFWRNMRCAIREYHNNKN